MLGKRFEEFMNVLYSPARGPRGKRMHGLARPAPDGEHQALHYRFAKIIAAKRSQRGCSLLRINLSKVQGSQTMPMHQPTLATAKIREVGAFWPNMTSCMTVLCCAL